MTLPDRVPVPGLFGELFVVAEAVRRRLLAASAVNVLCVRPLALPAFRPIFSRVLLGSEYRDQPPFTIRGIGPRLDLLLVQNAAAALIIQPR